VITEKKFCPFEFSEIRDVLVSVIMVYSYNKTNEMHQFLSFVFGIELYMFRTVSLSIIRGLALYTQQ
jgi:hypothetical protein